MRLFISLSFLFMSFIMEAQKSDFDTINFQKADSIANSYQGYSLNNLPILAYKLTQNLDTQVEKFRAIHTWVCLNIESDHSFSEKTIRKRKKFKNDSISFSNWNAQVEAWVFQRLLEDKKTICSGYAYLLKELSSLVNIECDVVNGYSRTVNTNVKEVDIPNHSWNTVKLNNKWYVVDATLASGFFFVDENVFVKNYNDGYFLAEPKLFSKNHYPLDAKWLLLNDKSSIDQFVKAPIIYGNTYKHELIPILPEKLVTQILINEDVVFKLQVSETTKIEDMRFIFSNGLRSETIKLTCSNYKNGFLEFNHQFIKKGNYDVHLMANTDLLVSYSVKVKK